VFCCAAVVAVKRENEWAWPRFRSCNSAIQLFTVLTISRVLRSTEILFSEVLGSLSSASRLRLMTRIDDFTILFTSRSVAAFRQAKK
jgi:hypothetical protein